MIGTAAGLALTGMIPFASTFAIFAAGRAWEQVRQSIAYPELDVKIVATHGGVTVGEDGVSHQMTEDLATMRVIPNMTVLVPADGIEMKEMIKAAVDTPGPFYIRASRMKFPVIFPDGASFKIGRGTVVREGSDITIIALGLMVSESIKAADLLKSKGISSRIVNMSTLKPIDKNLITACAKETGAIVTAEEHSIIGGLGSAVCEVVSESCPVPVKLIGVRDRFCLSGTGNELLDYCGLRAAQIARASEELLKL
jgi:transketolase